MLSKNAVKLLQWLSKKDQWMTASKISKECKHFNDRAFNAIAEAKYIEKKLDCDDGQWVQYRISDPGKAYLEGAKLARNSRTREWLALIFSGIAIVISIVT